MEAETTQSPQSAPSFDLYNFLHWLNENRQKVLVGAVAVALIASGIGIFTWKKGQNEINANEELFALPAVYGASEKAARPTPEALLKIAQDYPTTGAGEQSQLLAAGIYFTDHKYDQAYQEFSKFVTEHDQSPLAAQAYIGMAASLEASGKTSEAIQKYQDVITKFPNQNVVSPAKLTLARLFEEQNKPKEALDYYEQLVKSPTGQYDPWAGEARERKDLLLAKHPELDKSIISSFSVTTPPAPSTNAVAVPAPAPAPTPAPAPPK